MYFLYSSETFTNQNYMTPFIFGCLYPKTLNFSRNLYINKCDFGWVWCLTAVISALRLTQGIGMSLRPACTEM